jgi:hypothetical protein
MNQKGAGSKWSLPSRKREKKKISTTNDPVRI